MNISPHKANIIIELLITTVEPLQNGHLGDILQLLFLEVGVGGSGERERVQHDYCAKFVLTVA